VLIMSHEVLELTTDLAPTTSANESKVNDFGVANSHDEYNFEVTMNIILMHLISPQLMLT
jgi:hypothetical protein